MTDDRLYDVSKLVAKLTTISGHTCDFATLLHDIGIHENIADITTLLTIDHVTDITPILLKIGIERALFICDELCAPAIVRKIIRKQIMLDRILQNHIINLNVDDIDIEEIFEAYKRGYKIIPTIDIIEEYKYDYNISIYDKHTALLNGLYVHNLTWFMNNVDTDRDIIEKNIGEIRVIQVYDAGFNNNTINVISACTNVESLYCEEYRDTGIDFAQHADSFRNLCFMPNLRHVFADGILEDKCLELCHNIYELNAYDNSHITTCDPFAHSLRVLNAGHECGICDAGLIRCTRLKNITVNGNSEITTCAPFAKTLRILSANWKQCGINDDGLLLCTNLKKMYCNDNCNITTCAPFAKTIRVLYTENNLLSDSGLVNCTKLKELNHTHNTNITTFAPFAKTLKVLYSRNTTIGENEIKLCSNLVELHCDSSFKTTTDNPFPKSLRKLDVWDHNNPDKKFYYTIKSCPNLQSLNISRNYNVPGDILLPQSLTALHASGVTTINDTMLQLCTNLRDLNIAHNNKITSCAPFARTLKILNATYCSGVNDAFILSCTNLKVLDSDYNPKITIDI